MAAFFDYSCCTGPPIPPWLLGDEDDEERDCVQDDNNNGGTAAKTTETTQSNCNLNPKANTDSNATATADPYGSIKNQAATATELRRREKEEKEALGWTLDASARGLAVMGTAVFVSSELLRLAKDAAGCSGGGVEATNYDSESGGYNEIATYSCDSRVYGMKPTSLLTNIMTVVGLISAFLMPLIGSVIDHTSYRRAVGRISGAAMTFFILIQMLLLSNGNANHWFAASFMQILIAFFYQVHLCVVYAYLPELTYSAERLVQYTATFTAAQYGSSVLFLVLMVVILSVLPSNLLEQHSSTDFSQSFIVCVCGLFLGYAWTFLFRKRPASQHVPEGSPLLTAGFYKTFQTSRTILLHHSAIKWFLLSVCFTEAATYTFSTIAITYMTDQLNFTSRENGICILILLLFGVPGTRLAAWTNPISPIRSLQACLLLWVSTTSLAALIMKDPGQQNLAYVFAMFWGLCLGWIHPTEKTLYCTIIPRGQEAELMGTYICAGQILSWLPSLVFTVMNEAGISMRIGLFSLTFYFITSFFLLFMVGDYDEAVAHARKYDNLKLPNESDAHQDHHDPEDMLHSHSHHQNRNDSHPQADFIIIEDYEEAVAHKRSLSLALSQSDVSSTNFQC